MSRQRSLFHVQLAVVGFLQSGVSFTQGFASNLIVTTIGCMTELSTEEVIMNNVVKSPEDSDFPKMHLVVLDASHNHLESPYHYPADETEISLAFVNPYSEDEFSEDLQFVMEVEGPASFLDGGTIGCDGNIRVAARLGDKGGEVLLRIADPTAKVRVWGGWATGQNSVRLTPDLILEPAPLHAAQRQEREVGFQPEEVRDFQQGKESGVIPRDEGAPSSGGEQPAAAAAMPRKNLLHSNNVPPELEAIAKRAGHMKHKISHHRKTDNLSDPDSTSGRQRGALDMQKVVKDQQLDLAEKARQRADQAKDRYKDLAQKLRDDKASKEAEDDGRDSKDAEPKIANYLDKKRKINDEQSPNHRKHLEIQMREKYNRADSAHDLDMLSFGIGCGFFILSISAILLVYGKKRDKGRRDL